LGNGEEWTVPSMPLGPKGKEIAQMMDEMGNEDDGDVMDKFFTLMLKVVQVNYPTLTREQAEESTLFHMGMYADITKALTPWVEPKKD